MTNQNVLGLDRRTDCFVDNFEYLFRRGAHIHCIDIWRSNAASRTVLMSQLQEATPLVGPRTWSTGLVGFAEHILTIIGEDNRNSRMGLSKRNPKVHWREHTHDKDLHRVLVRSWVARFQAKLSHWPECIRHHAAEFKNGIILTRNRSYSC